MELKAFYDLQGKTVILKDGSLGTVTAQDEARVHVRPLNQQDVRVLPYDELKGIAGSEKDMLLTLLRPLSNKEALELADENDNITVNVEVDFNEMMGLVDMDQFNDFILPLAFENDYLAQNISYNPVAIVPREGMTNDIAIAISANISEMEAEDDDDDDGMETVNEIDDIDPNPGHDPND